MQKLSKKERRVIYQNALNGIQDGGWYICSFIRSEYILLMDELMLCAPIGWVNGDPFGASDFNEGSSQYIANSKDGNILRQTILMFCIEMTKDYGKKR